MTIDPQELADACDSLLRYYGVAPYHVRANVWQGDASFLANIRASYPAAVLEAAEAFVAQEAKFIDRNLRLVLECRGVRILKHAGEVTA
jgi:hypothetical protein